MNRLSFSLISAALTFFCSLSFAKADSFFAPPDNFTSGYSVEGQPCLGSDHLGVDSTGKALHCVGSIWKSASAEVPSGTLCGFAGGSSRAGGQPVALCQGMNVAGGCPAGYRRIANKDQESNSGYRGPNRYYCAKE